MSAGGAPSLRHRPAGTHNPGRTVPYRAAGRWLSRRAAEIEGREARVAFPAHITAALKFHLADFVAPEADALVFTSPTGATLRHGSFRPRVWLPPLAGARPNSAA